LLFAATAVFFGGTFVAAKAGLPYVPPLLFVSFRFDIASVLLIAFVLVRFPREEWLPRTKRDLMSIAAAGVLPIGLANGLLFVGQQYTTSAIGSIIFSLNPILTPAFAAVLLSDERLSRVGAIGMAVAFAGVGLVIGLDPTSLAESLGIGQLILLGGAVSAALGSVLIRWADGEMTSTVRTAWGLPLGAALCHALSFGAGERLSAVQWTPTALLAIGYVSVFSGMLAYIAYFNLLDDAGAIRANLAFYGVPVVAAIGGWAVLGESITALTVVGFLTVFAGFGIIGREEITEALKDLAENHAVIGDRPRTGTERSVWNDQD
jgi:drug/metabolite transporter (DMT)-like permease